MFRSTSSRGASIVHIPLARKRIKDEFLQIRMYLEHPRYRTSILVWRSMITMVKLDSFDTFDMQWMFWVCYRIVRYSRLFRPAFHHRKGNKPSMAFSVAPSSSLGIALNLFIFNLLRGSKWWTRQICGRTTQTKYQCIYNSQWRHHDRQPCIQCSSERNYGVGQAIDDTVQYFCHSSSWEEQSVIFAFDSTLRVSWLVNSAPNPAPSFFGQRGCKFNLSHG